MSHFYANPLSVLMEDEREPKAILKILQPEHLDAIRMLPSFKKFVERLIDRNDVIIDRGLLRDDTLLLTEIEKVLVSTTRRIIKLLRTVSVLSSAAAGPVDKIKLYIEAFRGTINDSDFVQAFLASMKLMLPNELVRFLGRFTYAVENGNLELAFEDWTGVELGLMNEIIEIKAQLVSIIDASTSAGESVRSQYTTHSRGARTTVIAQKIHLSSEQATLSKQDIQYTRLIDRLSVILEKFFTFEDPQNMFLNESWLYDFITPHKEVFAPRPRFAVEQALSAPHEYLPGCKDTGDSLSSVKPTTTILYQMYLESGSLVNASDIWTAFFSLVGSEEREAYDERTALMLFYRGLAELKQLGMIKQSKKKVDHLAKTLWKGI
jgi:origin recognition complex subunit 3